MSHEYLHNSVQGKIVLKHLYLLHGLLHFHLISSKYASAASGNAIYFGTHSPEILSKSLELVVGISQFAMQLFSTFQPVRQLL